MQIFFGQAHKLKWDWYNPEENLYTSSGEFPIKASRGMYLKEVTAWNLFPLKGKRRRIIRGTGS